MTNKNIYLHKIATCVPETYYTQDFALEFMLKLIGDTEKKRAFLTKIYKTSAINKRHTVIDDYGKDPSEYTFYPKNAELKPEPTLRMRNEIYITEANRLSLAAVTKLFHKLPKLDAEKITHLITVSCTGFSAPGFDLYLSKQLLRKTVNRFHIGFMGCFAAFPALKIARNICLSEPDARVLVVNVELCSLHFQQSQEPDIIIANMLFADGVSAALVSAHEEDSEGDKIILHRFFSRYLNDSEDKMAWKIGDIAFDMKLSVYVPQILKENIMPIMADFYRETGLTRGAIDLWAIHPGGRLILDNFQKSLGLSREDLSSSYDVFRKYGNMSSATIMFVLEKFIEQSRPGKIFSAAFGPGLTVETGFFEKVS